jgi:hypothetical protein
MESLGDRFWQIVDGTVSDDYDAQLDALAEVVSKLSREEIIAFAGDFQKASAAAYRWDLWGAAYLINGGCSDDGFIDFRSWLIAQGKSVYDAALANPESLAGHIMEGFAEFEEFAYVPMEVFETKFGEDWPGKGGSLPPEPEGERWEEAQLDALFPKLKAKVAELEEI